MKKGSSSSLVLTVVIAIVILFVGLFAINMVGGLISDSEKLDYSYSTATNSTLSNFNSTVNATHKVTIAGMSSITGETATKTLTSIVENRNGTSNFTITTYLNGAVLGTFTAVNNTNTTKVFSSVAFANNTINNLTYATTATGVNPHNIRSSVASYPTGSSNTYVGDNYDSLTTNTGTIYDVVVLVVIVFALAIAIGSLRGLSSGAGGTGAM